jgi:GNAT superfamily N-acetyltransferase
VYAAGHSLEDGFDEDAWCWIIRMEDQVVAAARLTIHEDLTNVPDAHLFRHLISPIPEPVAYISRLVVHPAVRGRGLTRTLDELRIEAALEIGCRSMVVVWNPKSGVRRKQQLMELGFGSADGETPRPDGGFGFSFVYHMVL